MTQHRLSSPARISVVLILLGVTLNAVAAEYTWQDPKAEVVPTGDLKWKPEPFAFQAGQTVRYIDFAAGDDTHSGESKDAAWKHHPWDTRAGGKAAAHSGPTTYVFKRGVSYRIFSTGGEAILRADESGRPGEPIRLTSDPSWGRGEAIIAGSRPIAGAWKKASSGDAPGRLETAEQTVWYIDVPLPRRTDGGGRMEPTLYVIEPDGGMYDLHLASDVGWEVTNPNFAMHHWNTWDEYRRMGKRGGGYYDKELKGKPADWFEGGTVWSQYAWVIANATPGKTIGRGDYDPQKGTLKYKKGTDPVNPGTRYLVEDLPQFLDAAGEFYYDRKRGRLFARLREDRNPNDVTIEIATALGSIDIVGRSHIEVSGLTFRFNGRDDRPFASNNVIRMEGDCSNIAVRNCTFEHLGNDAIWAQASTGQVMDHISVTDCDFNWVNGGTAVYLRGAGGKDRPGRRLGRLLHGEILRCRVRNIGLYRHDDHRWSNVAALSLLFPTIGEMAGNIVDMTWGSGLVSQGGAGGKGRMGYDLPLGRILVHHNKSENNALGVNDYGGLSLWQHGAIYSYCNIIGNSVGYWPGGFYNSGDRTLSYPIYLDGGFKIYNFNNISWSNPKTKKGDYGSRSSAYFNVFGYLNPFVNNTIYGSGSGFGGTSGNRNDNLGNVFAEITGTFVSANHGGNPSLIGGGDTGESGIDGAETLAYGFNVFHGPAEAGVLTTVKRGAKADVQAKDLATLREQMARYPLRFAQLGKEASELPIAKPIPPGAEKPSASDADFRPAPGSPAIDGGVDYFIPWQLYATVGEWHFNANHADPTMVLDYHYYPTRAYFNRSMYYRVPVHELEVSEADLDDYVPSPSENWVNGALAFDGTRTARVPHEEMAGDLTFNLGSLRIKGNATPPAPWEHANRTLRYPGKLRKTLDIRTTNLLVEATLRTEAGKCGATVLGKHDGTQGYALRIDESGKALFEVASGGKVSKVASSEAIHDGQWHHVLAEIDRSTGRMTVYVDGKPSGKARVDLAPDASLSNEADFLVGSGGDRGGAFRGAIDFMRVCQGTLEDAETDIAELYAWQTQGPVKHDFAGRTPRGRRDAGAIER